MHPIACLWGENIHIDRPVDPFLMDNLKGLRRLWASWFDEVHNVEFDAPRGEIDGMAPRPVTQRRTISCFSGGVDSLFTLVRHRHKAGGGVAAPIDDLMCIAGFNTSMDDLVGIRDVLGRAARKFGKRS